LATQAELAKDAEIKPYALREEVKLMRSVLRKEDTARKRVVLKGR